MNSNDLNRISSLPENLSRDEMSQEMQSLLSLMRQDLTQNEFLMSALFELAERQWRTYEILPEAIRNEIDILILKIWDKDSLDSTEKLLGIMARLGLSNSFSHLLAMDLQQLHPAIAQEIASASEEFGPSISDPYSGM